MSLMVQTKRAAVKRPAKRHSTVPFLHAGQRVEVWDMAKGAWVGHYVRRVGAWWKAGGQVLQRRNKYTVWR